MKVLVFGGGGLVGSKFLDLNNQFFNIKSPSASEIDILNKNQITEVFEEFNPDSIVNFAAYTQVEEAEKQRDDKNGICFQINAIGAKNVAEAAKNFNKNLIHISTEYVFDGTKDAIPYTEEDTPNPINWYGQTKLAGEQFVINSGCAAVIVRISMPFSASYKLKKDIARFFLEQLKTNQKVWAVEDQRITPTLVNDIADALKVLIGNKTLGIYHISSKDSVSPLEFVKILAETFGLDYSLINSTTLNEFGKNKKSKLLKYSWLNPAHFEKEFGDDILHSVEEGLLTFKREIDQN
ncbi:NAD(P)-dependent oxidoreductase [Candidatus Daviesbacteria bacterium]|nr:NAD(P)-dependent oxidoreductase [Candidatus Daviesbacteria bacterium]